VTFIEGGEFWAGLTIGTMLAALLIGPKE